MWSLASSAPGICGYCGVGIQAQGNRVCLAGHCLTRARFAPFLYTHAPEVFQTSSPSSLPQYNRKMPIWEIPSVGSRIKVNRNSDIQENKSSYLHRVLITFTFYYRCIHFFFWMCKHNVLDISKVHSILNFRDKKKILFLDHNIMIFCLSSPNCSEILCGILLMNFDLIYKKKL